MYDRIRRESEAEKKTSAAGSKKKKNKAMTLEEFNNLQVSLSLNFFCKGKPRSSFHGFLIYRTMLLMALRMGKTLGKIVPQQRMILNFLIESNKKPKKLSRRRKVKGYGRRER